MTCAALLCALFAGEAAAQVTITSNPNVSVAENQTAVTTVTADTLGVTFSLTGGPDEARFNIGPLSGALTFSSAPDFETPTDADGNNTYVVEVTATALLSSDTGSQIITVTVTNVPEPPTITSNGGGPAASISVAENSTAVTTVTANNPEGGALTFGITGGADQARFAIVPATGVLTFSSPPDFENPTDVGANNSYMVIVTATAPGGTDSQTITVSVTDQPDTAPIITSNGGGPNASISVAENQTAVTTVTADNPGGGALTFSLTGGPDQARFTIGQATGVLTFSSAPDFENPTDVGANNTYIVIVTATAAGGTDSQTITVTVTNEADAAPSISSNGGGPSASISVAENQTAVTTVTADNPEGGTLTFSITGGADQARFAIVPATGVLTFSSAPDFENPTDVDANSTYVVIVTATAPGGAASQTITVTVTNVNEAPNAVANTFVTNEDTRLDVAAPGVLGNDTDPDAGATLTAVLNTTTANGALTLNASGSFSYMPNANFSGTDSFTYRANDGALSSSVVTVTITVNPVNDAPTAVPNSYSTAEDTTLNVAAPGVLGNDTDPDSGTTLTAVLDTNVSHGTLTLNPNGSFRYVPNADFNGPDSFTYHASDGALSSNIVTVSITVTDVNDAPVIASIADQVATEITAFSLNLASFVTDADTPASSLVYALTTPLPAGLTLGTTGALSGIPALTTSVGDFSIGFSVNDGQNTVPASFRLTVLRAGRADLALSIGAAPNPVSLNTTATWTFTITNNAPQVNVGGVSLQAVFRGVPFQFDSSPAGCTLTPAGGETQLSCVLGPLAGGATTLVTIPGRGNFAGDVFTTGTVAIVGPVPIDETTRNDTASGALSVAQGVSATPAQAISGLDARAAAAGDLNGDGFLDLAVVAGPSQSSVVLLNVVDPANANKRVLSGAPISLGDQAANNGIVLADLDGDSDLDVVTATGAGTANGIFLNDGSAAFMAGTLGDPSWNSRAVAAGDINGDLLTDLVFANGGPSPVYVNRSAASFAAPVLVGNADSRGVVLADLFGDALPELVFANADGGATIYRNTGGTFQLALTLPTGPTTSVAAADFNNDGRFDLVFGRSVAPPSGVPSNLVWLNTSTTGGSFFLSNEIGAAPTTAVAVADFDLDGDTDILIVNDTGGHQVYTNVAAASGTFALHRQQMASAGALAAAVGKFSVDARVDAALVGTNGVAVFYNDGAGNLGSGDITAPIIQLRGEPSITLTVEDSYTDAGATATDTIDGDVTARIVVDNPVNTAVIGTYTVTYNATDLSGNSAAPVTRTVRIQTRQGTGGGGGGAAGLEFALWLAFVTVIVRLNSRWRFRSNAS